MGYRVDVTSSNCIRAAPDAFCARSGPRNLKVPAYTYIDALRSSLSLSLHSLPFLFVFIRGSLYRALLGPSPCASFASSPRILIYSSFSRSLSFPMSFCAQVYIYTYIVYIHPDFYKRVSAYVEKPVPPVRP